MTPRKLSKPPLRRIVGFAAAAHIEFGHRFTLECDHEIWRRALPSGLMESWRRVRCKECVR